MDYKKYITIVDNWTQEGVQFKDITTLMDNGPAYKSAVLEMAKYATNKEVDIIVGPEERGFIIGCPVAYELGVGFAPVRKKGNLQHEVIEEIGRDHIYT